MKSTILNRKYLYWELSRTVVILNDDSNKLSELRIFESYRSV